MGRASMIVAPRPSRTGTIPRKTSHRLKCWKTCEPYPRINWNRRRWRMSSSMSSCQRRPRSATSIRRRRTTWFARYRRIPGRRGVDGARNSRASWLAPNDSPMGRLLATLDDFRTGSSLRRWDWSDLPSPYYPTFVPQPPPHREATCAPALRPASDARASGRQILAVPRRVHDASPSQLLNTARQSTRKRQHGQRVLNGRRDRRVDGRASLIIWCTSRCSTGWLETTRSIGREPSWTVVPCARYMVAI